MHMPVSESVAAAIAAKAAQEARERNQIKRLILQVRHRLRLFMSKAVHVECRQRLARMLTCCPVRTPCTDLAGLSSSGPS